MDLASGYSDSINYGNGYTPLATGAINNNNADYLRNQIAIAQMAQAYNPYANSGGSFGAQPAYYAGQGAAYTGATGGNIFDRPAPQQPNTATMFDGLSAADMAAWQQAMYSAGRGSEISQQYQGGGIGSDRGQSPNQPGNAPIPSFWQGVRDWTGMTSGAPSYEPSPQSYGPGYFDNTFGSAYDQQQRQINGRIGMQTPNSYFNTLTGNNPYPDPATPRMPSQGGYTYGGATGGLSAQDYATFSRAVGPEAAQKWLAERGGAPQAPQTQMQMPDQQRLLGYNPQAPIQNSFAGRYPQGMAPSFDVPAQTQQGIQDLQRTLGTIDKATGNQSTQPYGGELPPFWQGARDFFGMGAPQPTPPQDTWSNRS